MKAFSLDETLFQLSAAHQSSGFPASFFDDPFARATTRLYGALLAPAMWLFDGDVALRIDKVVSALLFASAALPAALLARTVLRGRWTVACAGIAAVAVPWAGLSTALFSESVAYPAFVWLALAVVRALERPGVKRELVVLLALVVALLARVQLLFAAPGWIVAVVATALLAGRPSGERRLGRVVRIAPITSALVALGVLVVLLTILLGRFHQLVTKVVGEYSSSVFRDALPADSGLGGLVQVQLIGLGVGLLSAIVAVAWYVRVLSARDVPPAARRFAIATLALSASLFALTIAAQNGFVGGFAEERYYFYAVPFVWIAALAAWERAPAVSSRELVAAGVPFVVVMGALTPPRTLGTETGFLAPVSTHVDRLLQMAIGDIRGWTNITALTDRDVLWPVALIGLVALVLLWRTRGGGRIALGLAGAVQVGLLLYVLGTSSGLMGGGVADRTTGPSFAAQGFVDRHAGGEEVRWLEADPLLDPTQVQTVRLRTPFFNRDIRSRLAVAGVTTQRAVLPIDRLPQLDATAAADGALGIPAAPTVQWTDSPIAQVGGRVAARSPDGLVELRTGAGTDRLQYAATGLSPDGALVAGTTAQLRVWPSGPVQLQLTFAPPLGVPAGTRGRIEVDGTTLELPTGKGQRRVTVPLCAPGTVTLRGIEGQPAPDGRTLAGALVSARLRPAAVGRC